MDADPIYELREFVCKECGHKVVRNPNLPLHYEPNVCKQCWEQIVRPRHRRLNDKIMRQAQELTFLLLGDPRKT